MALELNSVLRLESQDVQELKDVKTAVAEFPADDPCAAAARVLISAAYATVELGKKEANKLKARITTLNDSLALERGRANDLRTEVDAVIKEKDVALSTREAGEREIQTLKHSLARERNRADALQEAADEAKAAGEREMQIMKETHSREMETLRISSANDCDAYQQMKTWMVDRCSAFEAERNAMLQGIRQQLDEIPHFLPPNSFLAETQPTIPDPAAGQKHSIPGNVSVPPKRPRTESDPTSRNQPDTSAAKRPRTESSQTITIASATPSTARGQVGLGAQFGFAHAQRPAASVKPQPRPTPRSPVPRSNAGPSHTSPRDPRLAPGYKQQASKSYGNGTHRPSNTSGR